jgi:hypothetical protein
VFAAAAVLAAGLSFFAATAAHGQAAILRVRPDTIPPGGSVRIDGAGFTPRTPLNITLRSQRIGLATSDESGAFSVVVKIPIGALTGTFSLAAGPFGSQTITASTFLTIASPPPPTILPSPDATFPAISTTLDSHPPPTFVDAYAPASPASSSGRKAGSIAGWAVAVAVVGLGIGAFVARRSSSSRRHGKRRHRPRPRMAALPPGGAPGGTRRPQPTGTPRPPRAPRPQVEPRKAAPRNAAPGKAAARQRAQLGRDGRPRRPRPLRARPRDEPE